MNWAAALFAAGLWWLLATAWLLLRPRPQPMRLSQLGLRLLQDLLPGLLLGLLFGRLL
ncbi:hypothetical protein NET02_06490 [Thermomicrobiaceae bacterium CFH 74404]|uniref:Uncharacterized protein n=1 Tax=Thermalbibacter longus TaxID=2951981 RepID=A0AA41WA13_9BACT|nr:hypothetical protein [Thermalbibacter longus]MCM8748789.1 hypothetical protein [Thermalbibacter longus]